MSLHVGKYDWIFRTVRDAEMAFKAIELIFRLEYTPKNVGGPPCLLSAAKPAAV